MLGLAFIFVFLIYLLISIGVIAYTVRKAKERGIAGWKWGVPVTLVMYLIVFWDHIPTLIAHKYYCEKEAEFFVYKTLDQWKQENPGVAETLVANRVAPSERQGSYENYVDTYFLNQRFNWVVKHNGKFLFNRWRHEQEVVDSKTNEVLARYVDFSTAQIEAGGGWYGWKFWLHIPRCNGGSVNQDNLRNFKNELRGVEK